MNLSYIIGVVAGLVFGITKLLYSDRVSCEEAQVNSYY